MTRIPVDSLSSRRRFLHLAGVTGLGSLAGCSEWSDRRPSPALTERDGPSPSPSSEPTRRPEERYDHIVDVVEAGGDPNGNEPIEPILEREVADDTLLRFPPGVYLFSSPWRFEGYSNLGVVGDGATLVPVDGLRYWFIGLDLRAFELAGFTLDHRGQDVGPQVQVHATEGHSVVRDITVHGFHDSETIAFTPYVEAEDASLTIERVRIPDGTRNEPAIYMGPESVGTITFRDCLLVHCAQGIYGSAHSGPLRVFGGVYANNNKAGIRVGGGNGGAHIRGVHIRIDDPLPDRWTNPLNLRGIWLREGDHTVIENCTIELLDQGGIASEGAIHVDNLMGRTTIRNTRIRSDVIARAIRAQDPSSKTANLQGIQGLPGGRWLECENVQIVGTSEAGEAIRVSGRDGSTFRNVTVDQPNGARRGLILGANAKGCSIVGGKWVTGQYPLVITGDRTSLSSGACPIRIEDVSRFEAVNLDRPSRKLETNGSRSHCIYGTAGEEGTEIAIAVSAVRDGSVFGEQLVSDTFGRPDEKESISLHEQ